MARVVPCRDATTNEGAYSALSVDCPLSLITILAAGLGSKRGSSSCWRSTIHIIMPVRSKVEDPFPRHGGCRYGKHAGRLGRRGIVSRAVLLSLLIGSMMISQQIWAKRRLWTGLLHAANNKSLNGTLCLCLGCAGEAYAGVGLYMARAGVNDGIVKLCIVCTSIVEASENDEMFSVRRSNKSCAETITTGILKRKTWFFLL